MTSKGSPCGSATNNGGMLDKLRVLRRRAKQTVLEHIGKAERTHDPVFEELLEKFNSMDRSMQKINRDVAAFAVAMRTLVASASTLAESFCELYGPEARLRGCATENTMLTGDLDAKCRQNFEEAINGKVLEPIRELLQVFPAYRRRMDMRQRLLLDYDSYRRKVKELKDDPKAKPDVLKDKEMKLKNASDAYQCTHDQLVLELAALDDHRADLIDGPFIQLLSAQMTFLKEAFGAFTPLQKYIEADLPRSRFTLESLRQKVEETKDSIRQDDVNSRMDFLSAPQANPSKSPKRMGSDGVKARALYQFAATSADELSFNKGDVINVTQKDESGWWIGELNGVVGQFPVNYVQVMEAERAKPEGSPPSPLAGSLGTTAAMSALNTAPYDPSYSTAFDGSSGVAQSTAAPVTAASAAQASTALLSVAGTEQASAAPVITACAAQASAAPVIAAGTTQASTAPAPGPTRVRALFDYKAEESTELSFSKSDVITVLSQDPSGWWNGELNGAIGLFPSNFVEPL